MVDMWITTTVAGKSIGYSARKVGELCKTGKIFSDKREDRENKRQTLPYWHIDLLSFAYFLRYNKPERETFEKGEDTVLKQKVTELLNNIQSSEKKTYNMNEVCTILDMSKPTLIKKCFSGELGRHHILCGSFTLTDILIYIKKTPKAEQELQERYENALVNGDGRLFLYREVITAYAYFKEYGYAI